jgi:adenine phosphoribosyltransferase
MDLVKTIRTIYDFPQEGVVFRDITTLLKDKDAFRHIIKKTAARYLDHDIDYVIGIEARGFIFGAALAVELGAGFIPIRKKGKLPGEIISKDYGKEYGKDVIEIHRDAFNSGDKILLVDDLLATGGTARAAVDMLKEMGADLKGILFMINQSSLGGLEKFPDVREKIFCLIDEKDFGD